MRRLSFFLAMTGIFTVALANASTNSVDPHEIRHLIDAKIMSCEGITLPVSTISDFVIEKDEQNTKVRFYTPLEEASTATIVMIHGGAWIAGNLDTHDNLARYLCNKTDTRVVSVGYTLAPEAKFDQIIEECYQALQWTYEENKNHQIVLVGDSAGGNLCAALSLLARDRKGPKITHQVLINPALDLTCNGTIEPQGDKLDNHRYCIRLYCNKPTDVINPYVSPILAKDLTNLPSTMVIVAEKDILKDEGLLFAKKLKDAGIATDTYTQYGIGHLAGDGARVGLKAIESIDVACASIKSVLHK